MQRVGTGVLTQTSVVVIPTTAFIIINSQYIARNCPKETRSRWPTSGSSMDHLITPLLSAHHTHQKVQFAWTCDDNLTADKTDRIPLPLSMNSFTTWVPPPYTIRSTPAHFTNAPADHLQSYQWRARPSLAPSPSGWYSACSARQCVCPWLQRAGGRRSRGIKAA